LGRFFAIAKGLIHRDPPDHTRLRKLLARAFTSRVVERMGPHIQAIVDGLLDQVQADGQMDIVDDLALPLPAIVIAELLGVPAEDRRFFVTWSAEAVSFAGTSTPPLELVKKAQHGYLSLYEYFGALIEERRKGAGPESEDPDLVTLLLDAGKDNVLSNAELVSTCVTLLIGGFETTTSLIANTLHLLLTHPEQRAALEADPSLMAATVEESLRYESPLQIVPRRVSRPVEIEGHKLEQGQLVFEMLGAANRDPARFPDPDRFDIRRDARHLAFGMGIHLCVGAPLARLEAPIALSSILRRMPGVEMADDRVQWNLSKPTARGPLAYNVTF
jgi:cytochrome P450